MKSNNKKRRLRAAKTLAEFVRVVQVAHGRLQIACDFPDRGLICMRPAAWLAKATLPTFL